MRPARFATRSTITAAIVTCALATVAIARPPIRVDHHRVVPVTGNWEGTSDGLGLSFALKYEPSNRAYGPTYVPYSFANFVLMEPMEYSTCKLDNASPEQEIIGLNDFTPVHAGGSFHVSDYGVPGGLTGARSARFSIHFAAVSGCPARTVTWMMHPAPRRPVSDGVWRVRFSDRESEKLQVEAGGRAIPGFAFPAGYTCLSGGVELLIGPGGVAKASTDGTNLAIQFSRRTARGSLTGAAADQKCHLGLTATLIKHRP